MFLVEDDGDEAFAFFLAERLHKTVGEVLGLPRPEFVAWRAYFEVRHVMADLHRRTEDHRAGLR